jgi:hypothetical protein
MAEYANTGPKWRKARTGKAFFASMRTVSNLLDGRSFSAAGLNSLFAP